MAFHGMKGAIFKNSRNNLERKLENILEKIRGREELKEEEVNQLKYSDPITSFNEHSTSILFLFRKEINGKTVYIYSQVYRRGNKGPIIYKPS